MTSSWGQLFFYEDIDYGPNLTSYSNYDVMPGVKYSNNLCFHIIITFYTTNRAGITNLSGWLHFSRKLWRKVVFPPRGPSDVCSTYVYFHDPVNSENYASLSKLL